MSQRLSNKIKLKSLFLFVFLFAFTDVAFTQKLELTNADKEEFKRRAVRTIELFQEALTIIPSFSEEPILKDKAIRNTLRLFTKDATMQLAYSNGSFSKPIPMPQYLHSLRSYEAKRELVMIDIIEFHIGELNPHPTELGKYIIEYEFVQQFFKKKDYVADPLASTEELKLLEWDYIDITTKGGTAIIEKNNKSEGTNWILLLGSIEARDIEVIKK